MFAPGVVSLRQEEDQVTHGLWVESEELVRGHLLEVRLKSLPPNFKTLLIEFVEGRQAGDGEVGWEVA